MGAASRLSALAGRAHTAPLERRNEAVECEALGAPAV